MTSLASLRRAVLAALFLGLASCDDESVGAPDGGIDSGVGVCCPRSDVSQGFFTCNGVDLGGYEETTAGCMVGHRVADVAPPCFTAATDEHGCAIWIAGVGEECNCFPAPDAGP